MELEDIYRPPQADMESPPSEAVDAPLEPAPFFQTSPFKVAVLFTATFGLYQLLWFYRQWDRRQDHGEDVRPLARTIFAVLFAYSLFQGVNDEIELCADLEAARRGPAAPLPDPSDRIALLPAGLLALLYFALSLVNRVPGIPHLGLLAVPLMSMPLVIVQRKINELHARLGFDPNEGTAFTAGSIAALAVGALFWITAGLGLVGAGR